MSMEDTNPAPSEVIESAAAEPRRWSGRRVAGLALVGVGAVVVGAVAVGIASADDTAAPSTSAAPGAPGWGRDDDGDGTWMGNGMRGMRGMPGAGMRAGGPALHGEFVVPTSDGGYQTVLMQRGEVTKASATSITVRSDDGFTATYDVTSQTVVRAESAGIDAIDVGDDVVVTAVDDGGTPTALHVGDVTALQELHQRFGVGRATPSPSAAA